MKRDRKRIGNQPGGRHEDRAIRVALVRQCYRLGAALTLSKAEDKGHGHTSHSSLPLPAVPLFLMLC